MLEGLRVISGSEHSTMRCTYVFEKMLATKRFEANIEIIHDTRMLDTYDAYWRYTMDRSAIAILQGRRYRARFHHFTSIMMILRSSGRNCEMSISERADWLKLKKES